MAQCTTCFGGAEPTNLNGESLAGASCSFLDDLASRTTEGTPGCQRAQINAYQGCGCPAYDEASYCTMCDDAFYEIPSRSKQVPLFPDRPECQDLLFTQRDGERSCEDVERAAYHCGCPGAPEPICSFCSGDNQVPAHANALLPPFYNQTCQNLHEVAPFYLSNETCTSLTADLPIHAEYYCGCMDIDPSFTGAQCNLCGGNGDDNSNNTTSMIQFPDWTVAVSATEEMTCAEIGRMAETATDVDFCTTLVTDYYSTCCLGIRPTAEPTPSPVMTPSPVVPTRSPESSAHRAGAIVNNPMWVALVMASLWWCRKL